MCSKYFTPFTLYFEKLSIYDYARIKSSDNLKSLGPAKISNAIETKRANILFIHVYTYVMHIISP